MLKNLRHFLMLIVLIASAYSSLAQDCGCDHVISPPQERTKTLILKGDSLGVKPGQNVCLAAGFYLQIRLLNFVGEPGNPVTIRNCGGLVEIGDAINFGRWWAMDIVQSQYLRVTGSGAPGIRYGVKLGKSGDSALKIGLASDVEIDHMDIGNANFAGILAKTDYRGNVPPDAAEMNNVSIHDNYIHDTRGEGMYIGETTTPGQDFRHLEIWNNIITRTGFEFLQVANIVEDAEVHHNVLYRGGLRNVLFQNKGLQIGDNSVGKYYNNFIIASPSNSMIVMGSGDIDIYNNYLQGAGDPGIFIDNRKITMPGTPITVRDNFLMEVREAVPFFNVFNELNPVNIMGNRLEGNNVVVGYGSGAGAKVTVSGNTVGPIERVQFTDVTTDNFSLPEGSPYAGIGPLADPGIRNQRPFIAIIPNQKFDAELVRSVNVKAGDHDGDAMILEAFNLPSFVSFHDNGDGTGVFNLVPQMEDIGVYHKVRVRVTDSKGSMNTQYFSINVLDPYAFLATASSSTLNNGPEKTLDNLLTTRWEPETEEQSWIKYDLREDKLVTGTQISFYNGTSIVYPFTIEVSEDNNQWTQVFNGANSGVSGDLEQFTFGEVRARYLRISAVNGSVNSYNEVVIQCTTAPILHEYTAAEDVDSDSRKVYNNPSLRIKMWRSKAYLQFAVEDLNVVKAPVISSRLRFMPIENAYGKLKVYLADHSNWTETSSTAALPGEVQLLADLSANFIAGQTYEIDLGTVINNNGKHSLILVMENSTQTLNISSSEGIPAPTLLLQTLRGATASTMRVETTQGQVDYRVPPKEMDEVDLYPNPVRDYVVVGINEEVQGKLTIEITDKAGKPLFRQSWENADRAIQIELNDLNLAPGFYFVKIDQEGLATKTRRLFKR
jgi:hypothetical protein